MSKFAIEKKCKLKQISQTFMVENVQIETRRHITFQLENFKVCDTPLGDGRGKPTL